MTEKHEELARELENDLKDELSPDKDVLEDKFEQFLKMSVSPESARESILRSMSSELGKPVPELLDSGSNINKISDISKDDDYANVIVDLDEIWDNESDVIAQKGLLADESGRIKFVNWSNSETPLLSENQTYKIESATVSESNGYTEIHFQEFTELEMVDKDIQRSDDGGNTDNVVVEGMVVDVLDSSIGVYKECTEDDCYKKDLNECPEHGDTLGDEIKFRLKIAVDNGSGTNLLYIYGSELDKLGFGLDKAKSTVISYDVDKLIERVSKELIFKVLRFEASPIDGSLYVNDVEEVESVGDLYEDNDYNRESFELFALSDFSKVDSFEKESDDEYAVNYAVLDSGEKLSRVLIPAVLTSVDYYEEDEYDYIVMNVTDVDGVDKEISVLYNDEVKNNIRNNLTAPCEILISGKLKEYEEDGEVKPTVNVEYVNEVDSDKIKYVREWYDEYHNTDKYSDV